MIEGLRDYQARAIEMCYAWMNENEGNPVIVAPTGAGKSWIIAALCEDTLHRNPTGGGVVMLSHSKELLAQDAEKILLAWPGAPVGIFSAGLKSKKIEQITVAGIQSIYKKADLLPPIQLIIVDEAHLINNRKTGMYRKFLSDVKNHNPAARVIGLTATPYRLGQGMLTDGDDALFQGIVESVTIGELVDRGFLAPLRSKFTDQRLDVSGVHVRGGEYINSELLAAVDDDATNKIIAGDITKRGRDGGRLSWLIFCAGVSHAEHMRDALRENGVAAEVVTGDTPAGERARILDDFKQKRIQAVTNANVLTTGFDAPDTDLIAFCRPTLSPGLYVQMAGRGMRLKQSGAADCLVLDYAGNVLKHGPITAVEPPARRNGGTGAAVTKTCPECGEIVAGGCHKCTACGYEFPPPEKAPAGYALNSSIDIMGRDPSRIDISGWWFYVTNSKKTGIPMLVVDYCPADMTAAAPRLREHLCLLHSGYARDKGFRELRLMMKFSGLIKKFPGCLSLSHVRDVDELKKLAEILTEHATPPAAVDWIKRGKYTEITGRYWNSDDATGGGEILL